MKKVIALLLSIVLIFSISAVGFAALETDGKVSNLPTIIVPGYSSSSMYYEAEDGTTEHVWGVVIEDIINMVLENIALVGTGLGKLGSGDASHIAETVGNGMLELYGKLQCNDDGTSKYNLKLYNVTAEENNSAVLQEKYPDGMYQHELEIMTEVAEYIGKENIYNFTCDFRMGAVDCAKRLDEFVGMVLEHSGAKKVNILAVSHGGQVTATYLTLFGHKKQVDNAVLTVPAIGGAGLAVDVLSGNVKLDEECLLRFIEHGTMNETDFNWLVQAQQLGFLDDIIAALLPYIYELLGNWTSIWDFATTDYYEELKALRLDEKDNAGIIKVSDHFHYEVLPNIGKGLRRCINKYGMNVSIIAGTGNRIVTGLEEDSDGIITTASSTGATVAPYNKRFADGYTAINGKKTFVSPAMDIDASTAYLPRNTWFVDGLFHGMTYKDTYTADLMMKLLLTDDITDIASDAKYPRFHATTNVSSSVYAEFDVSKPGYVTAEDTALVITNLSDKSNMTILAVNFEGLGINVDVAQAGTLAPKQSIALPFVGEIPAVSKTCVTVTVTYALTGNITPVNERKLYFTVNNGEAPAYDEANPYADPGANRETNELGEKLIELLQKFGLTNITSIFVNIFNRFLRLIADLF